MEARLGDPGSDRTTCFHTNCKRLCELHMVERIELVRWEIVDAKNYNEDLQIHSGVFETSPFDSTIYSISSELDPATCIHKSV